VPSYIIVVVIYLIAALALAPWPCTYGGLFLRSVGGVSCRLSVVAWALWEPMKDLVPHSTYILASKIPNIARALKEVNDGFGQVGKSEKKDKVP
jgi:hypothetical protein